MVEQVPSKELITRLRALGVVRPDWSKNPLTYFRHNGGRVSLDAASRFFHRAVELAEEAAAVLETRASHEPPAVPGIAPWQVPLWDAINRYVLACDGDPSKHVYGNTTRQTAVAEVERIVRGASKPPFPVPNTLSAGARGNTDPVAGREKPQGEPASPEDRDAGLPSADCITPDRLSVSNNRRGEMGWQETINHWRRNGFDDSWLIYQFTNFSAWATDPRTVALMKRADSTATPPSVTHPYEIPEELFDSHSVWIESGNVQSRDVTRVLDVVVQMIRRRISTSPTKPAAPAADPDEETPCAKRDDGLHCECWYGGNTCCGCGDGDKTLGGDWPTCAEVRAAQGE